MKERAIDLKKANIISLFIIPVFMIANMLLYKSLFLEDMRENIGNSTMLLIIPALIVGIVIHELIHGIFFVLYAKNGFKSIRFGVMWKHLAPYCHCSEPIKASQYRVVSLMPAIILGFIPFVVAYVIPSFPLLFFSCMMICGGMGDFLCVWLLRDLDKETLIIDHPSKAGFYFIEK